MSNPSKDQNNSKCRSAGPSENAAGTGQSDLAEARSGRREVTAVSQSEVVPSKQRLQAYADHVRCALAKLDNRRDAYCGPMSPEREVLVSLVEYLENSPDETSARDILQRLVDTCELATGAPWPALDEARAFLSGSPEAPRETFRDDARDAARYRYLRERLACDRLAARKLVITTEGGREPYRTLREAELDREIDECIGLSVEPAGKPIHDEECANCGAAWSKHLTNKLICPDAAIADIFRFGQKCSPEKASAPSILDRKVTVCAVCLRASCWQGDFYCDQAKSAGTVEKTIRELWEGNLREDSGYWFKDTNTGEVDWDAKSKAKRAWLAENGKPPHD